MSELLQAVVGRWSVRYELLNSQLTSTWSEHQCQARVAMNTLFTVCLLEAGLLHPWPVCLTMYLQVFSILCVQLQELEVTATKPCDTLAQLLFLWIKRSVIPAPGFREVWQSSVYTQLCGSSHFPAAAEAGWQPLTTFCAFPWFIYRMDRMVCRSVVGCVGLWGLGWAAQTPAWVWLKLCWQCSWAGNSPGKLGAPKWNMQNRWYGCASGQDLVALLCFLQPGLLAQSLLWGLDQSGPTVGSLIWLPQHCCDIPVRCGDCNGVS